MEFSSPRKWRSTTACTVRSRFRASAWCLESEVARDGEGLDVSKSVTNRPYEPGTIQQKQLRFAGQQIGLENVGWHRLRHTVPVMAGCSRGARRSAAKADVARPGPTTMNRYGGALMNEKRKANASVVRMVLRSQAVASDRKAALGSVRLTLRRQIATRATTDYRLATYR